MRLKSSIFLWVVSATAVPLVGIGVFATAYSERLYVERAERDISDSLGNLTSEIGRRMILEREVLQGIAKVPAVQAFLPVLDRVASGISHPQYVQRRQRLDRFLEAFETVMPSLTWVRVLDVQGNTLIKVQSGRAAPAVVEGLDEFPYVEPEPASTAAIASLTATPPGEVAYVSLPNASTTAGAGPSPFLDAVVPLAYGGRVVGYVSAHLNQSPIDRILAVMPRVHGGDILIAEVDPPNPERDGLILYDDRKAVAFTSAHDPSRRLQDLYPQVYRSVQSEPYGRMRNRGDTERVYYQEYLPYPNRLLSWVVLTRIRTSELSQPFQHIHGVTWVTLLMALVFSLGVTQLGARTLGRPMRELARALAEYARGDRRRRLTLKAPDEVRRAGEAFNSMADALERAEQDREQAQEALLRNAKLASIGQLAAGIGHEVNNPLNNILSLTKLILRALPEGDQRLHRDVAAVREEAERATRITRAVLNFARQVPPTYERFPVRPWLQDTLALVAQQARERGVRIATELEADTEVHGDPGLLQQVLVNLLMNAIQASSGEGTVRVVVRSTGARLILRVQDDGPGIAPSAMGSVFDPFFTTKGVGQGSGLGLSISLGIVQRHGGSLALANRPGGGVVATVELPAAETPLSEVAEAAE